ncbi:hypothetical protein CCH79_00021127 [Gambusia affinis]|uniref:Uncharacterized protein n=1 Tax=Gambusia affinis TaxID=33528 RepID=A0A315W2L4_GAMAF|nr:hypothetical protein CCH79_00021127 [Gambusia affinis]
MAKEKGNKMLHEIDQRVKTKKQNPLADKLAARYEQKQKQSSDMCRTERLGVLPGYRAEESRQKKEPQQKVKTQDNVTDKGRDVQYKSVLDQDSDKDKSREIHKKIVYDQLSLIQKKEANKRAFMEDRLLKERIHREAAAQNREKLEKEKKAAATKTLTDSWDSQIQQKQQEKKELRETERKDMLSLIESERVPGGENSKIIHLEKQRQPVNHEVWKSLPAQGPAPKTSNVCRPLPSRQKDSKIMPARLPSLDAKSVYLRDRFKYTDAKLPSIPRPK